MKGKGWKGYFDGMLKLADWAVSRKMYGWAAYLYRCIGMVQHALACNDDGQGIVEFILCLLVVGLIALALYMALGIGTLHPVNILSCAPNCGH